jgi:DivIVA domain-containing protein
MIDLTPLDVRNKRGDFKKLLRGYDPQEVDTFLELVAERLEELVRENMQFRDRNEMLQQQVSSQTDRERAVQEALVTAQELRSEMKSQAERRAELVLGEAQAEARRQLAEAEAEIRTRFRDAERRIEQAQDSLTELERRRTRFLRSFRQLLDREMDVVEVEESRPPLEERAIELDLGGGREAGSDGVEDLPDLDAPLDDLAAGHRDEVAGLFEARDAGAKGPATPEQDLFSTTEGPHHDLNDNDNEGDGHGWR